MGLSPPFLIALSLIGVRNCTIFVPMHHPLPDQKIDRDLLLLPEILIEQFDFDLDRLLKQTLDALWNASGYDKSPQFDDSEKWRDYPSS